MGWLRSGRADPQGGPAPMGDPHPLVEPREP